MPCRPTTVSSPEQNGEADQEYRSPSRLRHRCKQKGALLRVCVLGVTHNLAPVVHSGGHYIRQVWVGGDEVAKVTEAVDVVVHEAAHAATSDTSNRYAEV